MQVYTVPEISVLSSQYIIIIWCGLLKKYEKHGV
jgi:hypothetical protein